MFQVHLVLSLQPSREIFPSLLWLWHLKQVDHPEQCSPEPLGPDTSWFPRAGEQGHEFEGNGLGPFQTLSQCFRSGSVTCIEMDSVFEFNLIIKSLN